MSEGHIKKEHIKIIPGGKAPIAEVSGGEEYIDACAEVAGRTKKATTIWDDTKRQIRKLGAEARMLIEADAGEVGNIHILGSEGNYMEIVASSRRKDLKKGDVDLLDPGLSKVLVVERTEVTLRGAAALWAVTALQSTNFDSKEVTIKKKTQLVPGFEERRRQARAAKEPIIETLEKIGDAGIFSPAVEAKKK
jgi:hypothetical protein